jgi:hypothetical protein
MPVTVFLGNPLTYRPAGTPSKFPRTLPPVRWESGDVGGENDCRTVTYVGLDNRMTPALLSKIHPTTMAASVVLT